jgi:hypothetical protein
VSESVLSVVHGERTTRECYLFKERPVTVRARFTSVVGYLVVASSSRVVILLAGVYSHYRYLRILPCKFVLDKT